MSLIHIYCDLKAIRKEPLERFVVDTAIKVIFSDEIIERLIDLVMEAQQLSLIHILIADIAQALDKI